MKNKQIKWGSEILKAKPKTKEMKKREKIKQQFLCFFFKKLKVSISEIVIFSLVKMQVSHYFGRI